MSSLWPRTLAASAGVLAATALAVLPAQASIDAGRAADRPFLYRGFSADEGGPERTFAWVDGTRATLLVPRRSRADAAIDVLCEPYLPGAQGTQQMSATLNHVRLGAVDLTPGWQTARFRAPARAWQIGTNVLELYLSRAASPRGAGESNDPRPLSVAIDRLQVTR